MLRPVFLVSATAFWLFMTSQLIHREYFQLEQVKDPYEVLSLEYGFVRAEYRAIYMGKQRIGFNFNAIQPSDDSDTYELRHQTYLSFLFLGQDREMQIKGVSKLDKQLNLIDFDLKISSGDYWTHMLGQRAKDNLNLVIEGKGSEPVRKIIPVQGPLYFSESLNFVWTPENLKPGKKGRIQIWNPLLMNLQDIDFSVHEKTQIDYEGANKDVYVVHIDMGGIETRSWVTPEGIVLREETPSGLLLQKEPGWKIFDAMRESRDRPPDLPNLFSIPSNLILEKPDELKLLRVNVKTPREEMAIQIHKEDWSGTAHLAYPLTLTAPELAAFLQPTQSIQSTDAAIVKKMQEIVGTEKNAGEAVWKIMKWVHENILPVPTVSLPTSTEVLTSKRGDCNEYTVLFTALARAAGIPAKMVAGLVYQNGRFFYHAWAQVYLDRWLSIDPTFGQAPVDVTHIALVEGDLQEQMALVNELGKIKVIVLEAK